MFYWNRGLLCRPDRRRKYFWTKFRWMLGELTFTRSVIPEPMLFICQNIIFVYVSTDVWDYNMLHNFWTDRCKSDWAIVTGLMFITLLVNGDDISLSPESSDSFKICVSTGAISLLSSLSSLGCKQSGPWALFGSKFWSKFRTPASVILILSIDWYRLLLSLGGGVFPEVKTLLNCLLKILVFFWLSETNWPFSPRGQTPGLSLRLILIKDQKLLGSVCFIRSSIYNAGSFSITLCPSLSIYLSIC